VRDREPGSTVVDAAHDWVACGAESFSVSSALRNFLIGAGSGI